MKEPTKKQIERLNRVKVHCSFPGKQETNYYFNTEVSLGDLVSSIIKVLNESGEEKE